MVLIRFQPCWINTYCTYKTRTTYGKKAFFLPSSHLLLPLPHLLKSILFARPRILVITSDPGAHIHTTGTRGPVTVLKRSWRLNWGNSANSFPSELRIKCTWERGRRCEDGRDFRGSTIVITRVASTHQSTTIANDIWDHLIFLLLNLSRHASLISHLSFHTSPLSTLTTTT